MNDETYKRAEELGRKLKEAFPDVPMQINGIAESFVNPEDAFVYITFPDDELKEIQIRHYAAKLAGEYLEKYHTLITPMTGAYPIQGK